MSLARLWRPWRSRRHRSETPSSTSRFATLHDSAFRELWIAGVLVDLSIMAQLMTRGWLALDITGSNTGLGNVNLAFGLSLLLMAPVGGVVADVFAKRQVLIAAQCAMLVAALFVGITDLLGVLRLGSLMFGTVLLGAGIAVQASARVSLLSSLVERPAVSNALVLHNLSGYSSRIVGPAAAGALIGIEVIGSGGVFLMSAALLACSVLWTMRLPRGEAPSRRRRSISQDYVDAWQLARSQPSVRLLLFITIVVMGLALSFHNFLPSIAILVFGSDASGLGTMTSVNAVGAVVVSLWIAKKVSAGDLWQMQARSARATALLLLALAAVPSFGVGLLVLFALGGTAAEFVGTNGALLLAETEPEYHGRIQALIVVVSAFGFIIALPLGLLADTIGLRQMLAMVGALCLVAMVWLGPRERRLHPARPPL